MKRQVSDNYQFPHQQPFISRIHDYPSLQIKLIPSKKTYPFQMNKVVNYVELSYTCLVDKKVGREKLGIQVVGGYRMLRHNRQQKDEDNSQIKNGNFIIVFILLVDDLSTSSLYVPFSVYKQLKDINLQKNAFTNVQIVRFPIRYGPNLNIQSINQELEKITITNLRLPQNNQAQANELKQLITKIIIHPKFSLNMKNNSKNQKSQFQFLLFPQSKCKKVIIDLQWIQENGFLKNLQKLSLKTKAKLIKMKKVNENSNTIKQKNCFKYYLEFQITPEVKNKQAFQKTKTLYIIKFIPGKTLIEFQPSSVFNPSLKPFIATLQLSQIYRKVFQGHKFFIQLNKKIVQQIDVDSTRNKFICLKSDRSIGIGALLNHLTENFMKGKRFVKINCQKFATLNEFFNRLKSILQDGNTLIFIKNLSWLENLSKNEEIVQDTMKSLIQKINKTLQSTYQSSMCHFTCILYFSHTQIPQQLPKGTKRMLYLLQKVQKLQILNEIFQQLSNELSLSHSMKQTITNMLINSVGWTRIYKFLLNISKTNKKEPLTDKSIASTIQKSFSLENVENVTQVSWSDIGGLETAKEEIIQTVLLPTKHPQIFDQWIRPRTGLLFYGPPGTGKTLLGKCIAKQCKMGFISVKGPQLLNMYVGQSQKNVRQVFQRAKESKPCIVFMDELDALVPKRGNSSDSNAVMDRIVAQLLMQIDTASQNQVFVIGATNRPDLLDPSILRAGRFDKQIYLGISKNKQDRIKILKAQTRNSKLQQNFDYELIEQNVPLNFTGADFYGLTSKSMMRAVQRSIEQYQKGQVSDPDVLITTQDFLCIIPSVKLSVSEQQIRHYESLKERFSF